VQSVTLLDPMSSALQGHQKGVEKLFAA